MKLQTLPRHFLYRAVLLMILAPLSLLSYGQAVAEEKLLQHYREARSDSELIVHIGQLADYYYANKDFQKADSLIEKQIMIAESTMKPGLILLAYFGNAGFRSTGTSTLNRSQHTREYIQRALGYAKVNNLNDYVAMAYANLAALDITDGQGEEGFKNANLAFTTALSTENDSAKVVCAIQLGNTYLQRFDVLMAFKTYTNAGILAREGRERLMSPVFHAIAVMYKRLGNKERAKDNIFKSLDLNKKSRHLPGQVSDYIFLAKLSNYNAGKQYLQLALQLADSLQNVEYILDAEKILFFHMLMEEKPAHMLAFLDSKPELKNVLINTGPDYLDWMLAEIHLYGGGQADSALYYYRRAETSFDQGYDLTTKKNFFSEYAYCLKQLNFVPQAIVYYSRSFELAREASDLSMLENNADQLRTLYKQQGNFKEALQYSLLYDHFKDSVDLLGREKDLALQEIQNEEREQLDLANLAAKKLQRKHNLQYMLITFVIVAVFLLIIMIGMFRVSAFTIRLMGFLSLIFFFEFITLLLDARIHHLTHGEPWKIWLIKIGIISFLLPMHHFLERKLIHYLMSRHLLTIRGRLSFRKFFRKKKITFPASPAEGRETTSETPKVKV